MNFGGAFNGLKTKYFEIFSPMLLVLLAMVMVAYLMMTYTKFGRRVVALGGNEKNAFLSGINVNRYKIIVYGISGLFCAVASIVFVARIDSNNLTPVPTYETKRPSRCHYRRCHLRRRQGYDQRRIPRLSADGCHLQCYEHPRR